MSGDPNAVLQAAKKQLTDCDQEIGAIRAVLRGLGPSSAETEEAGNELTFEWLNPPSPVRIKKHTRFLAAGDCHEIWFLLLYAFIIVPAY